MVKSNAYGSKIKQRIWSLWRLLLSLSSITRSDWYPISNINSFLVKLTDKWQFSKIDLILAHYQIKMHLDDTVKNPIITLFGLNKYTYMLFGFKNASAIFQHYMNKIFRDIVLLFISSFWFSAMMRFLTKKDMFLTFIWKQF